MENFFIIGKHYVIETLSVDGIPAKLAKGSRQISLPLDIGTHSVEITAFPSSFQRKSAIKILLYSLENLASGGSGLNRKEIKQNLTGTRFIGTIEITNFENCFIDLEQQELPNFQQLPYLSNSLKKKMFWTIELPMALLAICIVSFLLWALSLVITP